MTTLLGVHRRTAARAAFLLAVATVLSVAGAPLASAWYPGGFTHTYGSCGDPAPPSEIRLTDLGEPLQGHTAPWSANRTTYNSPSHRTAEAVQRRAVAARVTGSHCSSGDVRWVELSYSRFEERKRVTSWVKGGGSERLVAGSPSETAWAPV